MIFFFKKRTSNRKNLRFRPSLPAIYLSCMLLSRLKIFYFHSIFNVHHQQCDTVQQACCGRVAKSFCFTYTTEVRIYTLSKQPSERKSSKVSHCLRHRIASDYATRAHALQNHFVPFSTARSLNVFYTNILHRSQLPPASNSRRYAHALQNLLVPLSTQRGHSILNKPI